MIKYDQFHFAAPPKTGSTYFIKCCASCGLGDKNKATLHQPPSIPWDGYLVSLVRHPYDWLCSYYLALEGGATGVHCVDVLCSYSRQAKDVDEFIALYLRFCPGEVGRIFDRYQASTVLRLEDFPWNMIEFFESLGMKYSQAAGVNDITPQNVRKGQVHIPNAAQKKQVVRAERHICDKYEYY